jgi:drug/metabolite transporter (DMT)-like permease
MTSGSGSASSALRLVGLQFLLVTSVGWGLNWPAMKFLLTEWPPLFARGLSGIVAAIAIAVIAMRLREPLRVPRASMPRLAASGFLNVFAWMGFSTLSLRWLSAGQGAMLVYTMPVWAMILAWPIRGRRPHLGGLVGLVLSFAGIGLLFGVQGMSLGAAQWPGIAFAVLAAVLFALGIVTAQPLPLGPFAQLAWQLAIGCAPMFAYGVLVERPVLAALSGAGIAAMAYMTVFPMAVCYLTWFAAVRRLSPAVASMGTLITPIVGVVSGSLLLGEPLGLRQWVALALVVSGLAFALRER